MIRKILTDDEELRLKALSEALTTKQVIKQYLLTIKNKPISCTV